MGETTTKKVQRLCSAALLSIKRYVISNAYPLPAFIAAIKPSAYFFRAALTTDLNAASSAVMTKVPVSM